MDANETFEQPIAGPGIILNIEAQSYLREAGKWASFLGILGFIACALFLLTAFSISTIFTKIAAIAPGGTAIALTGVAGFITVFFILIDVVYFFFALYLYQFGNKIKKGIMFTDNVHVTGALGKLKSFFKLWGIVTIIVTVLYILLIIGFIVAGVSAASMMGR